ncbi:unnamed protein product [Kuraishia capsulata CBS 1993]|uniref:Uncharacterized protein n=1 Tax=Kuraishia capsulata CBS 1993 TaxID=1382522 RepID=W6MUU4_9ASCO|nr:uncharacterized protein KUCA_T00001896001 [Kuraishia capsulata CBS 1993]CDK25925.1 unnamed protein product [Kuraishia capsulata CBS 1993]
MADNVVLKWPTPKSRRSKTNLLSNRPLKIPKTRKDNLKIISHATRDPKNDEKQGAFDISSSLIKDLPSTKHEQHLCEESVVMSIAPTRKFDLSTLDGVEIDSTPTVTAQISRWNPNAPIPRTVFDETEKVLMNFSDCVTYIYSTNMGLTCNSMVGEIFRVSYFDRTKLPFIDNLNQVLLKQKPAVLMLEDSSESSKAKANMQSFWVDMYLTYFKSLAIHSYKKPLPFFNRIARALEHNYDPLSTESLNWACLFCFYDSLSAMMAGRSPAIPQIYLTAPSQTQQRQHDSSLMATVGCPENIAAIIAELAHIIGSLGGFPRLNNAKEKIQVPTQVWDRLQDLIFEAHTSTLDQRFELEGEVEDISIFELIHDCWRWGTLIYIYSVFFKDSAEKSQKMRTLRDNILGTMREHSLVKTKQLLWPLFMAACQIPVDDVKNQMFCLRLFSLYAETYGPGIFLVAADALAEIWMSRKASEEIFWWEVTSDMYRNGKEILYA